jgi:hypothetical protein
MGFSLADVPQGAIRSLIGTRSLSAGTLCASGTNTNAKCSGTTTFMIDGKLYTKTTASDMFLLPLTVDYIAPGSAAPAVKISAAFGATTETAILTRYFFCGLDSAGTGYVYMSNAPSAAQASQDDAQQLPAFDDGVCIVGIIKVVVAAGSVFTPRSTALATAGAYTVTFTDVSVIPSTLP